MLGSSNLEGGGGRALGRADPFLSYLFTDLLLLTGLASSVFILSELLKLCEKLCFKARRAQVRQEDA